MPVALVQIIDPPWDGFEWVDHVNVLLSSSTENKPPVLPFGPKSISEPDKKLAGIVQVFPSTTAIVDVKFASSCI